MNKEDIRNKIREIVERYIFDKTVWDKAPENPAFIEDLKINSARIVDVILDIEDQYQIAIDDASLEKIIRLDDAVEVVIRKLS